MSDPEPKVGDEVAWNWGSSHIEGEVAEKTDKKITKEIKGKPITKNGEKDNPAYFVKQTKKKGRCLFVQADCKLVHSAVYALTKAPVLCCVVESNTVKSVCRQSSCQKGL